MCRSASLSVCPEGELWKNGLLDLDAVWGGEWDRSMDGCIRWGPRVPIGERVVLGFFAHWFELHFECISVFDSCVKS